MSGHGLRQTLLAQFHHQRAGLIVFIVSSPSHPPPEDSRADFSICPIIKASNCLATPEIFSGVSVLSDAALKSLMKRFVRRDSSAVVGLRERKGTRCQIRRRSKY